MLDELDGDHDLEENADREEGDDGGGDVLDEGEPTLGATEAMSHLAAWREDGHMNTHLDGELEESEADEDSDPSGGPFDDDNGIGDVDGLDEVMAEIASSGAFATERWDGDRKPLRQVKRQLREIRKRKRAT